MLKISQIYSLVMSSPTPSPLVGDKQYQIFEKEKLNPCLAVKTTFDQHLTINVIVIKKINFPKLIFFKKVNNLVFPM